MGDFETQSGFGHGSLRRLGRSTLAPRSLLALCLADSPPLSLSHPLNPQPPRACEDRAPTCAVRAAVRLATSAPPLSPLRRQRKSMCLCQRGISLLYRITNGKAADTVPT